MRSLLIMSLLCVAVSLLAMLAVSAMTFAPRPGAEIVRVEMLSGAGLMCLVWLALAGWLYMRQRCVPQWQAPEWLRRVVIGFGLFYLVATLLLSFG